MIGLIIYTVKKGDSIYTISRKYGVPMNRIISDNQLENPNLLMIGQALVLMTDSSRHKISLNQTLHSIARMYGTTVDNLISANPNVRNPYLLQLGQMLTIPQANVKQKSIDVNGYALPDISKNTLSSTLPYLSYISIFSYQIRPDGSLIPIQDDSIIADALNAGVSPMMVITNIREGGSFDSEIAHIILTDEQVQKTLFENVTKTLREKNYKGLNIDIEYIYPEDKENYNKFLEKMSALLRPLGYTIASAVAPKTSEDQVGLLYQAHDYKAHGQFMDHVIIMTYEWGYLFGHLTYK